MLDQSIIDAVLAVLSEFDVWIDEEVIAERLCEKGSAMDKQTIMKALARLATDKSVIHDRVNGVRIYKVLLVLKSPEQSVRPKPFRSTMQQSVKPQEEIWRVHQVKP